MTHTPTDEEVEALDKQMIAAGMIPYSVLRKGSPMDAFTVYNGMSSFEEFGEWLEQRRNEFLRMKARMTLQNDTECEMYEWVLSHEAAFNEALVNFRAAAAGEALRADEDK